MAIKTDLFPEQLSQSPTAPAPLPCAKTSPTVYKNVRNILNEPGLDFLNHGKADYEKCLKDVREFLLTRKNKTSPLQNLYNELELAVEETDEPSDILLQTLLSFKENEVPKWTTNGCQALGRILEGVLCILFQSAFPEFYEKGKNNPRVKEEVLKAIKEAEGTEDYDELKKASKYQVDIVLFMLALEIKYRCANGQGSTEQGRGAKNLKAANFCPVMAFLRYSPNAEGYRGKDWHTPQAEEALALIYACTGIDLIEFMQDVIKDKKIKLAITSGRKQIFRRTVKTMSYRMDHYSEEFESEAVIEMDNFRKTYVGCSSFNEKFSLIEELLQQSTPEERHILKQRFLLPENIGVPVPT
jgi:hypothetical protein